MSVHRVYYFRYKTKYNYWTESTASESIVYGLKVVVMHSDKNTIFTKDHPHALETIHKMFEEVGQEIPEDFTLLDFELLH